MGGSTPHFSRVGKIWKQRGHLTNHLGQLDDRSWRGFIGQTRPYDDCEIVVYELVETQVGDGQSIPDYLNEIKLRKQEREAAAKKRYDDYQRDKRLKQYKELKKEFGDVDE